LDRSDISSQLVAAQADLSIRLSNEQVQHLLSEKEESIQGLLQEGALFSVCSKIYAKISIHKVL